MKREPHESDADFKARRCLRFANAFREQAAKVASNWPVVAENLRKEALTAERAAGLAMFRAAELRAGQTSN